MHIWVLASLVAGYFVIYNSSSNSSISNITIRGTVTVKSGLVKRVAI